MTQPGASSTTGDRSTAAAAFAICAVAIGYALYVSNGTYSPPAIIAVTVGLTFCLLGILWPAGSGAQRFARRFLRIFLPLAILLQVAMLLDVENNLDRAIQVGIVFLALLALAQLLKLRGMGPLLFAAMVLGFFIILICKIHHGVPPIDVLMFQSSGSDSLLHGHNPYAFRYPNVYDKDSPFYGPGVVDSTGKWLTYGFPYPPVTLFMDAAGWLAGDVRYAHAASAAITTGLIYAARPGRISALAAAVFMLTPRSMYVVYVGWTEPLLALNFSLAMFCAVRWPKMLPYALGLFFATKQYTVMSVPALLLLVGRENQWRDLWRLILRAGIVAVILTLPLFLWNPHAFIRAIVLWQLVQPFRPDALSYLVSIYQMTGGRIPPIWTPFVVVIPIILLALRKFPRTPAGFAGAVTLINLAFFAFNKQAFCNYYYFVIVTACWAIGATRWEPMSDPRPEISVLPAARSN